ncbi:hypothetical protein [Kordia sp.]|uniref:hypothetical protein n=1 Tax=Kordia sp. TaxID=1965332 RepID=UPI003D6AD8A1
MKKEISRSNQFILTNQSISTINYVTDYSQEVDTAKNPYFTSDTSGHYLFSEEENNVTLPIFFGDYKTIKIPKGLKRRVKRLPKKVLKPIDSDIEIAIEKCFMFISTLTSTVFNEDDYWKSLSSTILHEQFKKGKDNTRIYKRIIDALSYSTDSTEPIIECRKNQHGNDSYQQDSYSKQYRLHSSSINQNLKSYNIKFENNIQKRKEKHNKDIATALKNPIGYNLIALYPKVILPTDEDIEKQGKKLVKEKYRTKKRKLLTLLNKKPKSYYSNLENRSFVEENIKLYKYLAGDKYMIPKIGKESSGGRVVDSFNLMPSWIRKMIKIDDEPTVELDFKALHPNIAMLIYGGTQYQITHQKVAEEMNFPLNEIKIEHLSFFNKKVANMKKSPLYQYYFNREKTMLKNLIQDKKRYGYKITSKRLFKKEVNIMSSIIKELNRLNIYVLYVYDALYCKASDKNIVTEIMNRIILKHKVHTSIG